MSRGGSGATKTDLRLYAILVVGLACWLLQLLAPPTLFGDEQFRASLEEASSPFHGLRWRAELRTEPSDQAQTQTHTQTQAEVAAAFSGYAPDEEDELEPQEGAAAAAAAAAEALGAPAVDLYSDELPVASPLAAAVLELELVAARPAAVPMDWARLLGDGKGGVNSHARAQSHFHFLFHQPVPNDVLEAFQFAGRVVSAHFEAMPVSVRVAVDWVPLEREVLAHAGPTAFYKVASSSGQQREAMVWLPKALMNQRVRYPPPDFEQPDMVLTVNSLGAWHLGLEGDVPQGHYDLVTVVIHELQHGLGFLSMVGQGNSLNGIETFNKGVQGEAYIFDRFVHVVGQGHIFSAPSVVKHRGLPETTIGLVWNSPSFTDENQPKLYVPTTFEGSSSISHLDEAAYPPGTPSSLMTPVLAKQEVIHNLGGLLIKMYEDMGWHMRDCTRYRSCGSCVSNLCRWCYDPFTAEGECGDPGAYPFFNAECRRPNTTDVLDDDHCRLETEEAEDDEGRSSSEPPPAAGDASPGSGAAAAPPPPDEGAKRPSRGGGGSDAKKAADFFSHRTQDDQVLVDTAAVSESTLDVVVAKATNECWDAMDCFFVRQHSASMLKVTGLALALMLAVVLVIYL